MKSSNSKIRFNWWSFLSELIIYCDVKRLITWSLISWLGLHWVTQIDCDVKRLITWILISWLGLHWVTQIYCDVKGLIMWSLISWLGLHWVYWALAVISNFQMCKLSIYFIYYLKILKLFYDKMLVLHFGLKLLCVLSQNIYCFSLIIIYFSDYVYFCKVNWYEICALHSNIAYSKI